VKTKEIHKIAVIGNAGGGKSTLSRRLAVQLKVSWTPVDAIQFLPGMKIAPHAQSIQVLREVQGREAWIIDGYGPLDILQERLLLADRIIFIDLPLWRHAWWCTKRQIKSLWSPREELPEGCREATLSQTMKLYKSLWKVHIKMRPELIRILQGEKLRSKVIWVQDLKAWGEVFNNGLQ
jgi:adenylate kinase family enzyme